MSAESAFPSASGEDLSPEPAPKAWDMLAAELHDSLEDVWLRRDPIYRRVRETIRHTSKDVDAHQHAMNISREVQRAKKEKRHD